MAWRGRVILREDMGSLWEGSPPGSWEVGTRITLRPCCAQVQLWPPFPPTHLLLYSVRTASLK